MKTIDQKVKEVIKEEGIIQKNNQNVKNFQKANDEFMLLVKKGITELRGNNLLSIDEAHLNQNSFNASI